MSKIDDYTNFMIEVANDDSHGYAQDKRNGNPDFDCSSLVGTALNKSGFNVDKLSTTRSLYKQLIACGFKVCSAPYKKGDIHLAVGHHVCVSTDATHIVHASINENGKTTNGKSGDQTGKEICIRTYYTPSYGWDYHLRYDVSSGANTGGKINMTTIKNGSKCNDVTVFEILMNKLGYYNSSIDASFGSGCVKACKSFQSDNGLTVDGVCGSNTWKKIFSKGC